MKDWKETCRERGTNPDWLIDQAKAIIMAANRKHLDPAYIQEKVHYIQLFIDNPRNYKEDPKGIV